MLKILIILFVIISIFGQNAIAEDKLTVTENGKTKYKILFDPQEASIPEKNAFKELKTFLQKVIGVEFTQISKADEEKYISVGRNHASSEFLGEKTINELGPEEFIIKNDTDGNIYILGGRPRGTLYGVFHLLDNIIGIKWLSGEYTYIPNKPNLFLPSLNLREKPAFEQRFMIKMARNPFPIADSHWQYRNRFNRTMYQNDWYRINLKKKLVPDLNDAAFGIGNYYAGPAFTHTIPRLIPADKYFKDHPEWWEMIDGERRNYGNNSAMCLSQKELIKETAQNAISWIQEQPDAKYISISEADTIRQYCTCPECNKLRDKYKADSGLLLNYVNQVADIIHEKYPEIIVTTLAYIHTEKPPENIKAGKNILVRLALWGASHSEPYNHPLNKAGNALLEKMRKWKKVCPKIGVWDYSTTYFANFTPHPNLHTLIPNIKALHDAGVEYYLVQDDFNEGSYSAEAGARLFLISRGTWNPNVDTDELLKVFSELYYGKKAGNIVRQYWNLVRETNSKAKYMSMTQGGSSGIMPSLKLPVVLKSWNLLRNAYEAADSPARKKHVQELIMQLQFALLGNWKNYEKQAGILNLKMPGTFDEQFADFSEKTAPYAASYKDFKINMEVRERALEKLKSGYYSDYYTKSSLSYGDHKSDNMFDDDLKTYWNGGKYSGWVEIEFNKPRTVQSIYTIFNWKLKEVTYEISSSMDGENWKVIVPKKKSIESEIIQEISASLPVNTARDTFKPVKARYIKTKVFLQITSTGSAGWITVREQVIE